MKLKTQNSKLKIATQNLKFYVLSFSFALCSLLFAFNCYAKEITILYTGETHAMLYPCNCPVEPDGGIARRLTLVKQLKANNPDTLILDTGGFFAGGLMDSYTQNVQLDMQRTLINLAAMESIGYDAVAIGDDEFNFGKDFLLENIAKSKLAFLSCNLSEGAQGSARNPFKPYLLKEVAGVRFGIIAVVGSTAAEKAGGLEFSEPEDAVRKAIDELKKDKADIIILLSHLGETEDLNLITKVQGIDLIFVGHTRVKEEPSEKIDQTFLVRPSWQGRRLGKLSLEFKDKKIIDYKVEEVRLSDLIMDDPQMLSILPVCFSDGNCSKAGLTGKCSNPGTVNSHCITENANKVKLTIILPKDCLTCDTDRVLGLLRASLPGLEASYLYYPGKEAEKLIKELAIKTLPVYLLDKKAQNEKGFLSLAANFEAKGNFYITKSQFSGINYFVSRKEVKGQLDLFISLNDKNMYELLQTVKDFKPMIHFLAIESEKGEFSAPYGKSEVEEYLRCVCVNKYYPKYFWDYITCRAKDINSSWWQDCLPAGGERQQIETCARSDEGRSLLKDNISLNKEILLMRGPTYLLDNQQIFASTASVKKEELEPIINKK